MREIPITQECLDILAHGKRSKVHRCARPMPDVDGHYLISVDDEIYWALADTWRPDETFSDTILRLLRKEGGILLREKYDHRYTLLVWLADISSGDDHA